MQSFFFLACAWKWNCLERRKKKQGLQKAMFNFVQVTSSFCCSTELVQDVQKSINLIGSTNSCPNKHEQIITPQSMSRRNGHSSVKEQGPDIMGSKYIFCDDLNSVSMYTVCDTLYSGIWPCHCSCQWYRATYRHRVHPGWGHLIWIKWPFMFEDESVYQSQQLWKEEDEFRFKVKGRKTITVSGPSTV